MPIKLVDFLVKGYTFNANIGLGSGPAFRFVKQCKVIVFFHLKISKLVIYFLSSYAIYSLYTKVLHLSKRDWLQFNWIGLAGPHLPQAGH